MTIKVFSINDNNFNNITIECRVKQGFYVIIFWRDFTSYNKYLEIVKKV